MKKFTHTINTITLASLTLGCALSSAASVAAPSQADLVPLTKGFTTSGKVLVKNIGKGKSRASWLTIQCLANACPEHPAMAAYENPKFPNAVTIKVPGLKPGASFSHQLSFWKKLKFAPGQYKFLFLADAGKDIPESNELNNKKIVTKKVKKPITDFTSKAVNKVESKAVRATKTSGKKPYKPQQHQMHQQAVTQLTSGPGKPDLAVTPFYSNTANLPEGFPTHSFCRKNPAGGAARQLVFHIENTGTALAQASQTKVFFNTFKLSGGASSTYTANVTPISAGNKKYMSVPIPADCYKPGFNKRCHFRIVADTAYQVSESEELTNNFVDSFCVSPAG